MKHSSVALPGENSGISNGRRAATSSSILAGRKPLPVNRATREEPFALQLDLIFMNPTAGGNTLLPSRSFSRWLPIVPTASSSRSSRGWAAPVFTHIVGWQWVELLKQISRRGGRISLMFKPTMTTFVEAYLRSLQSRRCVRRRRDDPRIQTRHPT